MPQVIQAEAGQRHLPQGSALEKEKSDPKGRGKDTQKAKSGWKEQGCCGIWGSTVWGGGEARRNLRSL